MTDKVFDSSEVIVRLNYPGARDMDYDRAALPLEDLQNASFHLMQVAEGAPLTPAERATIETISDLAETAHNLYDGLYTRLWEVGAADAHAAETRALDDTAADPVAAYPDPRLAGEAFTFALVAHNGDARGPLGTGQPYFTHLLSVAAMVAAMRPDQEALIVAILHDVVEDHPDAGATLAAIGGAFGAGVAAEIAQLSDPSDVYRVTKTHDAAEWQRRKRAYLGQIALGSDLTRVVKLADAIANTTDALADLAGKGKPSWTSSPKRRWYYLALADALDVPNPAPGYATNLAMYRRLAGQLDATAQRLLDGGATPEPPPDDGLPRV